MVERYETDMVGVADAGGVISVKDTPLRGTTGILLAIARSTGPVLWTVLVNGSPSAVGRGSLAALGPLVLLPGDRVEVQGTGAANKAPVLVHLVGLHSNVGLGELPLVAPVPGLITTDVNVVARTLAGTPNTRLQRDRGPMTLHVNPPAAVTPAAPYVLWHLSAPGGPPPNPGNADVLIHGWSLSFDSITDGGAGSSCFAALTGTGQTVFSGPTSNSSEIWNTRLSVAGAIDLEHTRSEQSWNPPLVAAGQDNNPGTPILLSDLRFEAPVAGTAYLVRGAMTIEVITSAQ